MLSTNTILGITEHEGECEGEDILDVYTDNGSSREGMSECH